MIVAEATVQSHVASALRKLGLGDGCRWDRVYEPGLMEPGER
jgi:DNA-binding NarL/FixJ family response regulator